MSAACTVWFYSPAKDRVTGLNVINKIVAGLDPPFCHVELQFPSGEACSIVMQGSVSLRARTFDREFYTGVLVRSDPGAVAAALALARAHVTAGTQFGVLGGRTFCSKLVLDLLCESGMVGKEALGGDGLGPSLLVTPSSLFRMLQRRQCVAHPLSAISFLETGPTCVAAGAGAAGAVAAHFFARTAVGFRHEQHTQKEKVPEDRWLLLGA
jgi:hypothetical protein